MRKIESVGNAERSASLSARAESRSWPNGFSMTTRRQRSVAVGRVVDESRGLQLLGDDREILRRDRQVVGVVAHRAALDVEVLDGLAQAPEGVGIVELARHEADALQQLLPGLFAVLGARVLLDGLVHDLREVLVLPVAAREAHEREARREQTPVGEVVHGGHELLARQVSCHAEDDERARTGDAVEAPIVRVAQRDCARARSRYRGPPGRDSIQECPERSWSRCSYWAASKSVSTSSCGSVRVRVTTGRPWPSASTDASPAACASMSWPNVNGRPGISRSTSVRSRIWRKTPFAGPPLWYCPVECRNRGPQPKVVGRLGVRGDELAQALEAGGA